MKKRKLFITGMGGAAGRALAQLALTANYQVGGTTHRKIPAELNKLIDQNLLKYYPVDLNILKETTRVIQDFQPDVVVHLAGKVLGGADKKVFDHSIYQENISIFKNVLAAIKKLNTIPRFILSSGCLIYNKQASSDLIAEIPVGDLPNIDPITQPYKASKADQEKILSSEEGLDYIIARPTQFTGPGKIPGAIEWFIACEIQKIKKGEMKSIEVKNKLGEVDILDVRDIAKAFLILVKNGVRGEIYHISSGSPVTVETAAKILLEISGLNPDRFPVVSTDTEYSSYFRFSPQKLNKLGWKLHYNLKDALTSYWKYFKNQER